MRRKKMGGCKNKRLIGPYLDGQLGNSQWLDEHIGECSECLAEYEAIQKLGHLAAKVDMAPPESHYWKNFSTRTMARIATRETQTVRSRNWLFFSGYKIPIRVFGLVAVFALVLAISVTVFNNRKQPIVALTTPPIDKDANSAVGITPEPSAMIPIAQRPTANTDVQTKGITHSPQIAAVAFNNRDSSNLEQSAMMSINSGSLLQGGFRSKPDKFAGLVEPDLPIGTGTIQSDVLDPNSDMIIVYQINRGSRAGEIPLMVYRQATVKFFGPEKAMPWRNIGKAAGPNWGYAAGDGKSNDELNKRLNMELDLSQDK
jgi:hypothetical protein